MIPNHVHLAMLLWYLAVPCLYMCEIKNTVPEVIWASVLSITNLLKCVLLYLANSGRRLTVNHYNERQPCVILTVLMQQQSQTQDYNRQQNKLTKSNNTREDWQSHNVNS